MSLRRKAQIKFQNVVCQKQLAYNTQTDTVRDKETLSSASEGSAICMHKALVHQKELSNQYP